MIVNAFYPVKLFQACYKLPQFYKRFVFSNHRYPTRQVSKPIQLEQNKIYFMQALLKDTGGGDHLSVKVKLPSGVEKIPLGGKDIYTGVPRESY